MRSLRSLLVLGGSGFLGSSLVRQLLATEGVEEVLVVDLHKDTPIPPNLHAPAKDPRFKYLQGDILQKEALSRILKKHELSGVFHLAEAHPSAGGTPEQLLATNITGTAHVLETCQKAGLPLLYSSTDEIYGSIAAPNRFLEESTTSPSTRYAASKASAELLCLAAVRSEGQEVVITRGSATYGPRQAAHHSLTTLVRNAVNNEELTLIGDGMQIRDWIHVEDHCDGMIAAYLRGRPGEAYNLSGHCERTELGMARSVLTTLGKPESLLAHAPARPGIDLRRAADSTKAARYFGWYPTRSFKKRFSTAVREIVGTVAS